MALYSMTQLVGKTILCDKDVNVYKVNDINVLGDNAKPVMTYKKGTTFTLDSWLAPRPEEKRTDGSIMYAKRSNLYFTFFIGSTYMATKFIDDGRFSLNALKDQGALSVKEEIELKDKEDDWFNNPLTPFKDMFKNLKPILILVLVVIAAIYLIPVIAGAFRKK